jgi:hypothetical protein
MTRIREAFDIAFALFVVLVAAVTLTGFLYFANSAAKTMFAVLILTFGGPFAMWLFGIRFWPFSKLTSRDRD